MIVSLWIEVYNKTGALEVNVEFHTYKSQQQEQNPKGIRLQLWTYSSETEKHLGWAKCSIDVNAASQQAFVCSSTDDHLQLKNYSSLLQTLTAFVLLDIISLGSNSCGILWTRLKSDKLQTSHQFNQIILSLLL